MITEPYSKETAALLNKTLNMLRGNTTIEDVERLLGVSNRRARDLIAFIAKRFPVVSTSDEKGYILLSDKSKLSNEQIEAASTYCRHMIAEHKGRAEKILERVTPLENWLNS